MCTMVVLDDGGVVVSWGVLRVRRCSKVVTVVVCFQTLRTCTFVLNTIQEVFWFFLTIQTCASFIGTRDVVCDTTHCLHLKNYT